ncbi:UvrD-helicase domain-containing protein [Flavobacteriaceae bacterium F08102]|nr:UvrD-helicase domain-containing protein [Flavobacteriaceae bacterium F08102]
MHNSSTFTVYNASAGSGKTFTLVKSYLAIVLGSTDPSYFKYILAVTFTNKAAAEMKERIISALDELKEADSSHEMMPLLVEELHLSPIEISARARRTLKAILQNYSAFSISTLDSFTYRLIRSFAFDLGLSLNFDVEMDAASLLNEAVEQLISQIGIDQKLTSLLIDFSLQKIDEDKSWDISRELKEIAFLLLKDNDADYVAKIQNRPIDDFLAFKVRLKKKQQTIKNRFKEFGEKALDIIQREGIPHTAFFYSDLPKHFVKLVEGRLDKLLFEGRLNKSVEENRHFYSGKATPADKQAIDGVIDELKSIYNASKEYYMEVYGQYILNDLFLKNIIPLAVLAKLKTALDLVKEERNVYLNAEFNGIISRNLQEQPAAYIYERLGDKFKHFFIDEMQDTSILQWVNLVPLIHNALSQENSSLLLVGDAKQSIYRWRGSEPEQFLKLTQKGDTLLHNPFHNQKEVVALETNYRSYSEVIQFNNTFFQFLSSFFNKPTYQQLYLDENQQRRTDKVGGFVQVSFIEKGLKGEERDLAYAQRVYQQIEQCLTQFSPKEICVLVRKKKHGILIADYLASKKIDIVSSETLLLKNSEKISFLIDLLSYINNPNDKNMLFDVLSYLLKQSDMQTSWSLCVSRFISMEIWEVFESLGDFNIRFDLGKFKQLSLFDGVEYILRSFGLDREPDAYILYFLEEVFQYSQKKANVLSEFLQDWDAKKEKLSIIVPDNLDAVQIMTIHKSKGLEFQVVIYPYDLSIDEVNSDQEWFPVHEEFNDYPFDDLLIPMSKELEQSGEVGEKFFRDYYNEKEFDVINLWYVTFTRAIEQLYIIGELKETDKELKTSSQFLIQFLKEQGKWNEASTDFQFGIPTRISIPQKTQKDHHYLTRINSTDWENHQIAIAEQLSWLEGLNDGAIAYGSLLHEMLSKVIRDEDVERITRLFLLQGKIKNEQKEEVLRRLKRIVEHEQLKSYFAKEVVVFTERELLNAEGKIVIPDRWVIFPDQTVGILDYKTGKPDVSHQRQLRQYRSYIEKLGYVVNKCLLVYIGSDIVVQEVE